MLIIIINLLVLQGTGNGLQTTSSDLKEKNIVVLESINGPVLFQIQDIRTTWKRIVDSLWTWALFTWGFVKEKKGMDQFCWETTVKQEFTTRMRVERRLGEISMLQNCSTWRANI